MALMAGFSGIVCHAEDDDYKYTAEFAEMDEIHVKVLIFDPDGLITDRDDLEESLTEKMRSAIPAGIDALVAGDDNPLPMLWLRVKIYERSDGGFYGMVELNLSRNTILTGVADPQEFESFVYSSTDCLNGEGSPNEQIAELSSDLINEFIETYEATLN